MNRSTNKIPTTRSPAPESLNHVNGKCLDQRTVTAAFLKSAFMNNFLSTLKRKAFVFLFCFVLFLFCYLFFLYIHPL